MQICAFVRVVPEGATQPNVWFPKVTYSLMASPSCPLKELRLTIGMVVPRAMRQ